MAETIPHDPDLGADYQDPEDKQDEPKKKGRPAGSSNAPKTSKTPPPPADPNVVQRALCGLFRGAAKVVQSDAQFEEAEFGTLSKELCDLSKKAPPLGVVLTALQPVIIIVEAVEKVARIRQEMPRRNRDKAAPDEGVRPFVPGGAQ